MRIEIAEELAELLDHFHVGSHFQGYCVFGADIPE
jgi:hypothetical protein